MSRGLGDGELVGVSTEHEACYKFGDMLLCSGAGLLSVLLGGCGVCGCISTDA